MILMLIGLVLSYPAPERREWVAVPADMESALRRPLGPLRRTGVASLFR